jgi:hypothetical protein
MMNVNALYTIQIVPGTDGGFFVRCHQVPEMNSRHATQRQAVLGAADALKTLSRSLGRKADAAERAGAQAA